MEFRNFISCLIVAVAVVVVADAAVDTQQLSILVQQQAQTIQMLQTKLETVEMDIRELKSHHTGHEAVAFTVRFSNDTSWGILLRPREVLKFDGIVTNIGNGYQPHNGSFVAPVSGVYAFFLNQMTGYTHNFVDLVIEKVVGTESENSDKPLNGTALDLVFTEGSGDADDQGASQVTTHLNAGESVRVRQENGDAVRGSWFTIFTGFLIHAD